ncbi:MAG: DUF2332 family protein [Elusimicrobia bacterium]|nr:DUF2332 family protein [Elusimicrobiota bacterium]
MTREEFSAQCERGAAQFPALPVTSAVLRWTAEQLRRGEPPWWKAAAKAWEKRVFTAWSEAWGLYLAALHFEALRDAESPLVPYFPSCGGTAEADPGPALARFLANPPPTFFESLRERNRRSYVAARSVLWIGPALLFFQRKRGLPFYLVEVNAGAGLNLAADAALPQKGFDSELVAARVGLDSPPLELADLADRRWLTAGVWPDNLRGVAELDRAIDVVQKRLARDPAFVQLAPCPAPQAPAFLAKNIPAGDPDAGLLLFNMGVTARMDDAEYARFSSAVEAALKPWGDRGLWVEVESVRGESYSATYQLRVHRLAGGALRGLVMARFDLGSSARAYSDAAPAFLEVRSK